MTEKYVATWDFPDEGDLKYHQEQVDNFIDSVEEIYGDEEPEVFLARGDPTEIVRGHGLMTVRDGDRFMDLENSEINWIKAEHKGLRMNYNPFWYENHLPVEKDYTLVLEGEEEDRDIIESNYSEKMRRTGFNRLKDLKRLLE